MAAAIVAVNSRNLKRQSTNGGCHCRPIDFLDQLYQLVGQLEKHGRKTWIRDKPEK